MDDKRNYAPYMVIAALLAAPILFSALDMRMADLLPEPVWEWIVWIFVPRQEFFQYHFDLLDGRLMDKLPFQTYIETIGRLREVSGALDGDASMFDITYELSGQQFQLDIGRHIAPHLYRVRTLITGLYVILLVYYNYRQIMFLIRGTTFNQGSDRGGRD